MDKLVSLSTFVRVVDSGSFAAAAEALDLTAAMVGRHVRGLEDSLGVQLLARTTRPQSLTEAGRVYYQHARAVLAEVEAAMPTSQPGGSYACWTFTSRALSGCTCSIRRCDRPRQNSGRFWTSSVSDLGDAGFQRIRQPLPASLSVDWTDL